MYLKTNFQKRNVKIIKRAQRVKRLYYAIDNGYPFSHLPKALSALCMFDSMRTKVAIIRYRRSLEIFKKRYSRFGITHDGYPMVEYKGELFAIVPYAEKPLSIGMWDEVDDWIAFPGGRQRLFELRRKK